MTLAPALQARFDALPTGTQDTIRSDADVWRYGNLASALESFESTVEWARKLTQEQRRYHAVGFEHSNQNMSASAVHLVQQELGDDPACEITLARL